MNETDNYILDAIRKAVWSGFCSKEDVHQLIDDLLEGDANEELLRAAVDPEFEKKALAEESWEDETDCDRLDQAFDELNTSGIIALQFAGYTMSDGFDDVGEEIHQRGRKRCKGYCFYHGQDLERAVDGEGLWLAYGDLDAEPAQKTKIGHIVKKVLEKHGFTVEWDGDPEQRILLPNLDWKRRSTP